MKRSLAGLGLALSLASPVWAAAPSDAYCADAVDFAMRTAERRDAGSTQDAITRSLRESPLVFKQQYPDLEADDMHELVLQVFRNGWSRFGAARATARSCAARLAPAVPVTPAVRGART